MGSYTVNLQGVEIVKVDDVRISNPKQRTVHKSDEEESAGRVEWLRRSVQVIRDRSIAGRVKGKVYKAAARPAMIYGLEIAVMKTT